MSSFNDYYADWKHLPDFIMKGMGSAMCLKCRMNVLLPWSHIERRHPEEMKKIKEATRRV